MHVVIIQCRRRSAQSGLDGISVERGCSDELDRPVTEHELTAFLFLFQLSMCLFFGCYDFGTFPCSDSGAIVYEVVECILELLTLLWHILK